MLVLPEQRLAYDVQFYAKPTEEFRDYHVVSLVAVTSSGILMYSDELK